MNRALLILLLSLLYYPTHAKIYCVLESKNMHAYPTKGFVNSIAYGLCSTTVADNYCMQHRWAPQELIINGAESAVKNPLEHIYEFSFLSKNLTALVGQQEPTSVYITSNTHTTEQAQVSRLAPACMPDGTDADRIESLGLFYQHNTLNCASVVSSALQPKAFGLAWSTQSTTTTDDNKSIVSWKSVICPDQVNKSCSIALEPIQCGFDQGSFESFIKPPVLYWSHHLQRMIIGASLQSRSDADEHQAMSNLSVASVDEKIIRLQPFCDKALVVENDPFYAQGPHKRLYVHHLGEFVSRSHHLFLVMVGGQGTQQETAQQVWCAPLTTPCPVNKRTRNYQKTDALCAGSLAHPVGHQVLNQYMIRGKLENNYRCHHDSIIGKQCQLSSNTSIKVGGNSMLPGPVSFLYTYEDIIAVSVEQTNNSPGGIFYSRPLYDSDGHIGCWTSWQHLFGIQESVVCFDIDLNTAQAAYVTSDNTLKKSEWSVLEAPYSNLHPCLKQLMNHCALHVTQPINYAQDHHSLLIIAPYAAGYAQKNSQGRFDCTLYSPQDLQALGTLECGSTTMINDQRYVALGGSYGIAFAHQHTMNVNDTLHAVRHIAPCNQGFIVVAQQGVYRYRLNNTGIFQQESFETPQECGAPLNLLVWNNTYLLGTTKGLYYMHEHQGQYSAWRKLELHQQTNPAVIDCYSMDTDNTTINTIYVVAQEGITTSLHIVSVKHNADETLDTINCLNYYQPYTARILKQPHLAASQARNIIATDGIGVWYGVGDYNVPAHKLAYVSWATKDLCWHKSAHSVPMIQKKQYSLNKFFYSSLFQTWLGFGDFGLIIAH